MKLEPGQMIRDYQIIRPIGEGGMGEVYLANEVLLERQVAIKRLNPVFTQDPQFIQRFRNEARIQAQLTHENIVQLITFFSEADTHYMVLEYAPGHTLRDLIQQTGPIPEQRALGILRQIVAALAHAHSRGIIHRDIKPSNIMIDTEHGDRVKIMDFGIARLMTDGHLTRTGTKMGTIMYMSPEQVLALKDIDHRSDVYSLGVVFFEMLCGKTAYQVDTDSDFLVQRAIVDTPIPDPREKYKFISEDTVKLLKLMTMKDREERIGLRDVVLSLPESGLVNQASFTFPDLPIRKPDSQSYDYQDTLDSFQTEKDLAHDVQKLPLILMSSSLVLSTILMATFGGFRMVFVLIIIISTALHAGGAHIQTLKSPSYMWLWISATTYLLTSGFFGLGYAAWSSAYSSVLPMLLYIVVQVFMSIVLNQTYKAILTTYEDAECLQIGQKFGLVSRTVIILSCLWSAIVLFFVVRY